VIIPSSGVKASKLLILPVERKAGESAVKTAISPISKINGPNSALEKIFCKSELVRIGSLRSRF
jgi:hypothetical protein